MNIGLLVISYRQPVKSFLYKGEIPIFILMCGVKILKDLYIYTEKKHISAKNDCNFPVIIKIKHRIVFERFCLEIVIYHNQVLSVLYTMCYYDPTEDVFFFRNYFFSIH